MPERIRTFVAVDFSVDETVRSLVEEFGRMGRAVRPAAEPLHLTLKFLGDVDPDDVADVARELEQVAAGVAPFEVQLRGLGAFPRPERPSVVWIGLEEAEPLARLAADLDGRLEPLGFPPEKRAFHPHVTIARVKARPPDRLFELLEEHGETPFGSRRLAGAILYQSELEADGPRYTPMATARFGRSPS